MRENRCVGNTCINHCNLTFDRNLRRYIDQPLYVKWKRWECQSECRYRCMISREDERRELGYKPLKYYGKWPYKHVHGIQEPVHGWHTGLNTNVCLLMNVVTIGLNTNVCLLMNVVTITLWAVWAGITHHPSRWKLWSIVLGLFPSMILMILDFPPYQGFIDAHAMWHVTMVPITHVWWGFIRDDCEYRTAILTGKTKCCY
ncbi:post-GPI attachment to proteins factor [Striga asiatica]|uniref:Post-GPI attachment to proteins factor 3 n=1 Tax=Striga asiatica TaxID=4170 RepID=A0A5A7P2H8_STRAF|nr:post-GPI attachment to proteins factor [Striga asiatica]